MAEASTARYKRNEPLSIFDGIPITAKDEVRVVSCLPKLFNNYFLLISSSYHSSHCEYKELVCSFLFGSTYVQLLSLFNFLLHLMRKHVLVWIILVRMDVLFPSPLSSFALSRIVPSLPMCPFSHYEYMICE